jgi:hypothetical protein
MDRGVIVGGGLMAASFLVAVMLNRSAHQEAAPVEAVRQPPARACVDPGRRVPGATAVRETDEEKCTPTPAASAQR